MLAFRGAFNFSLNLNGYVTRETSTMSETTQKPLNKSTKCSVKFSAQLWPEMINLYERPAYVPYKY